MNKGICNVRSLVLLSCLVLILPGLAFGETHNAVQAALDYQLRENSCTKPKVITADATVSPPVPAAGSVAFFVGTSPSEVSDVDSYTRKRQERKENRWRSCVASYKGGLLEDMEALKNSASHGLTQQQAKIILANMAMIQQVYMTQDGVLEQQEAEEKSGKSDN